MKEKTNISLEVLLLNDLLRTKVIDKEIYDKAVKKITAIKAEATTTDTPVILATA